MTARHIVSGGAVVAVLCLLAGCQTMQTVDVRPGLPPFEGRTREARVTFTNGTTTTLVFAFVMADTILGTSPTTGLVHRIPTGTVRTIELQRHSKTRTASLLVAHASLVVTVIALVIQVQPHYRGAF